MGLTRTDKRRAVRVGSSVLAVVHILVPRVLLALARRSYRYVLAVEFEPTDRSARRVRLLGVCLLVLVALEVRRGTASDR